MSEEVVWIDMGDGCSAGIAVGTPFVNEEGVSPWECYGLHVFAWLPKKCRNGKTRWFCTVEKHRDGSYSKGRLN
jgi:hypothetical protein